LRKVILNALINITSLFSGLQITTTPAICEFPAFRLYIIILLVFDGIKPGCDASTHRPSSVVQSLRIASECKVTNSDTLVF
jgi:hypothetical protein